MLLLLLSGQTRQRESRWQQWFGSGLLLHRMRPSLLRGRSKGVPTFRNASLTLALSWTSGNGTWFPLFEQQRPHVDAD